MPRSSEEGKAAVLLRIVMHFVGVHGLRLISTRPSWVAGRTSIHPNVPLGPDAPEVPANV